MEEFKIGLFNIQLENDDNGRLCFIVTLFDKMFSIECFISEDDVLGFVSVDKIELLSSSSSLYSSISSDGGFGGAIGG
jgi:hypothetical protein